MRRRVTIGLGLGLLSLVGVADAVSALPAERPGQEALVTRMETVETSSATGGVVKGPLHRRQEADIETSTPQPNRSVASGRLAPPLGAGVEPDDVGARETRLAAANPEIVGSGLALPEGLNLPDDGAVTRTQSSLAPHPAVPNSANEGPYPTTAVPIPNAAWLFGSALVAFVTWSRRRTS